MNLIEYIDQLRHDYVSFAHIRDSDNVVYELSNRRKYIRIIRDYHGSRLLIGFIDKSNGNVLRGYDWNTVHRKREIIGKVNL